MKLILTVAALLSLAAPANAYTSTYRDADGNTYSTSCYHGSYGWQCRSWTNGTGNSAQVVRAPINMEVNTNPEWGKGCRSCDGGAK